MNRNKEIAVLFSRLLLGVIFLMQGFGKVFTIGVGNVYQNFFLNKYQNLLPEFLLVSTAYYTSYVELLAGLFLILGLFRDYSLYALASVLIIVSFGHGLADPIWDLSHVMYRSLILVFLLMVPKEWDRYSLDHLMAKK